MLSLTPALTSPPSRAFPQLPLATEEVPLLASAAAGVLSIVSGAPAADNSNVQFGVDSVDELGPSRRTVMGTPGHERFCAKNVERFSNVPLGPSASIRSSVGDRACTRYASPATRTTTSDGDAAGPLASVSASASAGLMIYAPTKKSRADEIATITRSYERVPRSRGTCTEYTSQVLAPKTLRLQRGASLPCVPPTGSEGAALGIAYELLRSRPSD